MDLYLIPGACSLATLAPPPATIERQRVTQWLSFINPELHKSFSPLSDSGDRLQKRFDWLHEQIGSRAFLVSDRCGRRGCCK